MSSRKWSKRKIKNEILKLHDKGVQLNSSFAQRNLSDLYSAAQRIFKGWKNAIVGAGLDYEKIRKQRVPYTKSELIEEIIKIEQNDKLNPKYVLENYPKVYSASVNHFGSWEIAVNEAGFDYKKILSVSKYKNSSHFIRNWSKQDVKILINKRINQGKSVIGAIVKKEDNSLYYNAIRLYKTWINAVESTGYNYCYFEFISKRKYTKESVAEKLRQLDAKGYDLSHSFIRKNFPKLYSGMLNRQETFKSYIEALKYAGIDPEKHRKGPSKSIYADMKKQSLIRVIKELYRKGEALNARAVDINLYNRVRKKFETWKDGIEAAGIEYEQISGKVSDEIKRGNQFELIVKHMFYALKRPYLYHQVFNIYDKKNNEKFTCIPDFSIKKEWIDTKLHSWTSTIEETIFLYSKLATKLTILYLDGNQRTYNQKNVLFCHIDDYYPELRKAGLDELIVRFELLKKRPLKKDELEGFN